MFLRRNCRLYIIIQKIAPQAKPGKYFQICFFAPIWGENGGVLSMRMQVILDSLFARPCSAPIWGGKKGEFRDWTRLTVKTCASLLLFFSDLFIWRDKWIKVVNFELGDKSVRQRKNLNPDRNRAHDLPNTGGVLYPLSHEDSWARFLSGTSQIFSLSHTGAMLIDSSLIYLTWYNLTKLNKNSLSTTS